MLDAYFNNALQYRDCVFRYKLLECHKESTLKSYGALDVRHAKVRACQQADLYDNEGQLAYALFSSRVMANQKT